MTHAIAPAQDPNDGPPVGSDLDRRYRVSDGVLILIRVWSYTLVYKQPVATIMSSVAQGHGSFLRMDLRADLVATLYYTLLQLISRLPI